VDLLVLGGLWLAMRPGPPDIRSQAELDRFVRGGRASVVELYSSFCVICMANRHMIEAVERKLRGAARLARVELPTAAGRGIGATYGVRYTPSYLLFDEHGDLVRAIVPDTVTPLANGYRILDGTGALMSRADRVSADLLADLVRFVT
jgi:hypothetical protein